MVNKYSKDPDQTILMLSLLGVTSVCIKRLVEWIFFALKMATTSEKVYSIIRGLRRPRSDCAFAQSDQGLRCPLAIQCAL